MGRTDTDVRVSTESYMQVENVSRRSSRNRTCDLLIITGPELYQLTYSLAAGVLTETVNREVGEQGSLHT